MGTSDTIKSYSRFILFPSLLPLLQVDAFVLTVVTACIRSCDTNNSTKSLIRIYHRTAAESPRTSWSHTLAEVSYKFVFQPVCNARSLDHQFFWLFSMKLEIIK